MKLKQILIILIACTFVFATCSEWAGDEGYVNIRIAGENSNSSSRTVTNDNQVENGQFDVFDKYTFTSDMFIDVYFVKEVVDGPRQTPKKGNIAASSGSFDFKTTATLSMVPGTYILIVSVFSRQRGIVAQGVVQNVGINPGKNGDIEVPIRDVGKRDLALALNPNYDPTDTNGATNGQYLDKDGNPTNIRDNAAIRDPGYKYTNPIIPGKEYPFLYGIDF